MERSTGRRAGAAVCALAALLGSAACSAEREEPFGGRAVIEVDRPVALVDEKVRIRVTGLAPGQEIAVSAETGSPHGDWRSRAVFRADGKGVVDLARAEPLRGTYGGADGMGLFWSMKAERKGVGSYRTEPPHERPELDVRLTVTGGGAELAERTLTRVQMAEGVRHRELTADEDGVAGTLYLPPEGAPKAAPALVIGGSEGGESMRDVAALLASRGHPALSVCYFGCEGRPRELARIGLEYFARAAGLLARQHAADPGRLLVIGASRGSEPAQMLAQYHPGLVEDAVVYASSNQVGDAVSVDHLHAWTVDGEPYTEEDVPLDRVRGKVLGIVGDEDGVWSSEYRSEAITEEEGNELLVYPRAGHFVAGHPYLPEQRTTYPVEGGGEIDTGGTRAGNARAKADSWPRVLRLLRN
ncbi:acyl-CoA thioesterase/BAAT N-terminal domain-containing protein [Streptomyces fenghuangensis]